VHEQTAENLQNEHLRGERARELLEHPLMAEVLALMERDLFERFKLADTMKPDELAELRRLVGAHHKFTNILRGYIASGGIAARQLAEAVKREGAITRAARLWRA